MKYENMPSNAICKYISVRILGAFRIVFGKNWVCWKGITLSAKDISSTTIETFCMNFDPNVVVVNSEISSRVMQHAGTRLGRYGSGEASGKKGSLWVEIFLCQYST